MSHRILKQFIYGTFYLVTLGFMAASVYLAYFMPAPTCFDNVKNQYEEETDCGGPCIPCAIRKLQPIKTSPIQLFDTGLQTTTLLVELQNPNLDYGASHLAYTVTLYDAANTMLASFNGDTFLYAGEVKPLVFPALEVPFRAVARSAFAVRETAWLNARDFPRPDVAVREVVTKRDGKTAVVEGVVQNKNSYGFKQMVISGITLNKTGLFAGASRTIVYDIQPFEERFFKIVIPLLDADAAQLDAARTRVFTDARR